MIIDLVTLSTQWKDIHVRKKLIEDAMSDYDGDVALALSTDKHVHQLNRDFRGKDKPTNVLSFPNDMHEGGDVILALETLRREAKAEDKALRDHLEHLIVHGCLHVFGYDHETDEEWDEMVKEEIRICAKLGFHPYPES